MSVWWWIGGVLFIGLAGAAGATWGWLELNAEKIRTWTQTQSQPRRRIIQVLLLALVLAIGGFKAYLEMEADDIRNDISEDDGLNGGVPLDLTPENELQPIDGEGTYP